MGLILSRIEDPRDPIEKTRRYELVRFAHDMGQNDITDQMQAPLIRRRLRERGLARKLVPWLAAKKVKLQTIGQNTDRHHFESASDKVATVDADEDLERQYEKQQRMEAAEREYQEKQRHQVKRVGTSEITALRKECKARGIKMARTDNLKTLRAKLDGQDAA